MVSLYKYDGTTRFNSFMGMTLTKLKLIRKFISFLMDKEQLSIRITKINNVKISQNQMWEYDKTIGHYVLTTDMRIDDADIQYKTDKIIR